MELDLLLFDKFRHVGQLMRRGRTPGMIAPCALSDKGNRSAPSPAFMREIILAILSDRSDGLRQKDLAEHFHISPSTMSEMLDRLEADDYLQREADPCDRRANLFILTEKGHLRADEIKAEQKKIFANLFRNLDETEKWQLIALLDKLLAEDHHQPAGEDICP